jgi:hypothetical protein
MKGSLSATFVLFVSLSATAGERADIIVAKDGSGRFRSVQEALDALPAGGTKERIIYIRNGLYNEKIFIRKSHITLVGEQRDSTRIVFAQLREEWNNTRQGSDWGAAVVNIDSGVTDITLANLTVENDYGRRNNVYDRHQFAVRGGGTRVMLLCCNVISDAGDALSLWNKLDGMYYHADCHFEGGVDYVCPRGWCYITRSTFFGHNLSASIWHDGDQDRDQKLVIRNSWFDGVPGFPLGRHHRDGQIYLVHCTFSRNMADRPIYRPPSSTTEWRWGARHYYDDCHRDGGDFAWFKDNLESAENSPRAEDVTARWTFGGRWDPEATMTSVLPFAAFPGPDHKATGVGTEGLRLTWVPGRNAVSHRVYFGKDNPPGSNVEQKGSAFDPGTLEPGTTYYWRVDELTGTETIPGQVWSFTTK